MKTIYIDISDFLVWRGHFTGIQRVIYNLVKELTTSKNVILVVYSQNMYQRISQDIDDVVTKGVKSLKKPHSVNKMHRLNKEDKLLELIRSTYQRQPNLLRTFMNPTVPVAVGSMKKMSPALRKVLHNWRELRGKNSEYVALHIAKQLELLAGLAEENIVDEDRYGPRVRFRPGDDLVVLGCLWDSVDHLEEATLGVGLKGVNLHYLVYDLIPIYAAHTFGPGLAPMYARYLFEVLSVAKNVFAISNSTRSDLRKFMKETGITNNPDIEVVRLGDELPKTIDVTFEARMTDKHTVPFALCVGTVEARKNHVMLYISLKLALENRSISKLPLFYIIGRQGWMTTELVDLIKRDTDINKKMIFMDDVTDEELTWLYKKAQFSVYISQYEGWGLPVAESLSYGTPVITSSTSSMKEISPELTVRVSPFDSRALLNALLKVSSKEYNILLRKSIQDKYKKISWSYTAQPIKKKLGLE